MNINKMKAAAGLVAGALMLFILSNSLTAVNSKEVVQMTDNYRHFQCEYEFVLLRGIFRPVEKGNVVFNNASVLLSDETAKVEVEGEFELYFQNRLMSMR